MHRKLEASSEVDIPTWNFFIVLEANECLLQQWKNQVMPLENIAQDVFHAIHHQQQTEFAWNTLLWTAANEIIWMGCDAQLWRSWRWDVLTVLFLRTSIALALR